MITSDFWLKTGSLYDTSLATYLDSQYRSKQLIREFKGIASHYRNSFESMGVNMTEDGTMTIDKDLLQEEYFGCHPCKNTSSIRFKTEDLLNLVLPKEEME